MQKNKFAYSIINLVKDNIINSKEPCGLICLYGLDKIFRYRLFWSVFNEEFNKNYRKIFSYSTCDKLDIEELNQKKLVIVENIHLISENEVLKNKLIKLIERSYEQNFQLILCSDVNIDDLKVDKFLNEEFRKGTLIKLEK